MSLNARSLDQVERRKNIDAEIDRLRALIRVQLSDRNTTIPVAFLPSEVLSRVFVLLRNSYLSEYNCHHSRWFQVSHVSRHWRSVALDCPSLWQYVPVAQDEWQVEMIRRAKSLPLSLRFQIGGYHNFGKKESVTAGLNILERAAELHVYAKRAFLDGILKPRLQMTPLLRSVSFKSPFAEKEPLLLFTEEPPSLRSLRLTSYHFAWSSSIYHGLVHLSVSDINPQVQITTSQLLNLLRHTPHLQSLRFLRALNTAALPSMPGDVVNLPSLTEVNVSGPAESWLKVFGSINSPSIEKLKLDLESDRNADITSLFPVLRAVAERAEQSGDPLRTIRVAGGSDIGALVTLKAWKNGVRPGIIASAGVIFDVRLHVECTEKKLVATVVKGLRSEVPLSTLENLFLASLPSDSDGKMITSSFGDLPGLANIFLHNMVSKTAADMLKASIKTSGHRDSKDCLFRSMERLTLSSTTFTNSGHKQGVYRCLRDFLKRRRDQDRSLAELRLVNCGPITESNIDDLRKLVHHLYRRSSRDLEELMEDDSEDDRSSGSALSSSNGTDEDGDDDSDSDSDSSNSSSSH